MTTRGNPSSANAAPPDNSGNRRPGWRVHPPCQRPYGNGLPPEIAGTEQAKRLYEQGCVTTMDIAQLIYQRFRANKRHCKN
jgi:hypothetical protein